MALIHCGIWATLKAIDTTSTPEGSTALIYYNLRTRVMKLFRDIEYSDNDTDWPYYLEPATGPGTWIHQTGNEYDVWNGYQIVTGLIQSVNWAATAGSEYDLDNAKFRLGGSDVNAALDTTPGVFMGLDDGSYKLSIGKAYGDADAQSFIKWDGSAMSMRLASGETFDLYGDLYIKAGGDIILEPDASNPGVLKIKTNGASPSYVVFGPEHSSSAMYIFPEDANEVSFYIGHPSIAPYYDDKRFLHVGIYGSSCIIGGVDLAYSKYAILSCTYNSGGTGDVVAKLEARRTIAIPSCSQLKLTASASSGDNYIDFLLNTTENNALRVEYKKLTIPDDTWIGIGSTAGRIIFRDETVDEISVLAAGFGGQELLVDPANPSEGNWIMWMSDGTGSGNDGDIMMKITAGGTTKTVTLVDFSAV